jgi:hypothetical protein
LEMGSYEPLVGLPSNHDTPLSASQIARITPSVPL